MRDKKIDDLIYGYLRTHSEYDVGEDITYCYKSYATPKKIMDYFKENAAHEFPYAERTISTHLKLLCNTGYVCEDTWNGRKVYAIENITNNFAEMPLETLRYLVNTATPNVIKVYAFLKYKQTNHNWLVANKDPNTPPYRFSKKSLCEMLGYAANHVEALDMIEDILNCLINNELIVIHREMVPVNSGKVGFFFCLDAVNEEYKNTINSKRKKNNDTIKVSVAADSAEKVAPDVEDHLCKVDSLLATQNKIKIVKICKIPQKK